MTLATPDVLSEVYMERRRQDMHWGEQNHDPFAYLAILGEEVGESNRAALEIRFGYPDAADVPVEYEGGLRKQRLAHLREELIQVAAVAVAHVECLDRAKWSWGENGQPPHDQTVAGTLEHGDQETAAPWNQ